MQTAITLSKLIHKKGLMQETQIFPELFYCSTTSNVRWWCECGACLWHATRVVPQTAPTSLKQILFSLFTTVIWGLSTEQLLPAFNGKNSMPTSSYCTPMLCMRTFLGVHTQVTKVSMSAGLSQPHTEQLLQINWHSITYYLSQQLCFMCLPVPLYQG